jgi:hypothetical protein
MMRRALFVLLTALAGSVALAAPPATDHVHHAHAHTEGEHTGVFRLLGQFEGLAPAEVFRKASADPVADLLALRADAKTPEWARLRVLDALSLFPEARSREALEQVLQGGWVDRAPPAVHRALNGLTEGFGAAADDTLRRHLEHPDPEVRVTAVYMLTRSPSAHRLAAVRARLSVETDPTVVWAIRSRTEQLK